MMLFDCNPKSQHLGRLRQVDWKFQARLGYFTRDLVAKNKHKQ